MIGDNPKAGEEITRATAKLGVGAADLAIAAAAVSRLPDFSIPRAASYDPAPSIPGNHVIGPLGKFVEYGSGAEDHPADHPADHPRRRWRFQRIDWRELRRILWPAKEVAP